MKIAIVEDEQYFATHLTELLQKWKEREKAEQLQIAAFTAGEGIVEEYKAQGVDYDVIFMDIQLDQLDGVETSRRLRRLGYGGAIVFTTNHREYQYVRQGYDVDALNYLAKPVQLKEIAACMERLKQNTLFRYTYNGVHWSVPHKEILFFESIRSYMKIHALTREIEASLFKSNVQDLLQQLPKIYVQTHRSYITNMIHVVKIQGSNLYLRNGDSIPIGKNYLDAVLTAFQEL